MTTLVVPEGAVDAGTVAAPSRPAARPGPHAGRGRARRQAARPSRRHLRGGSSSAPWVRRRHPAAPSGRPGGAPAPTLAVPNSGACETAGSSVPAAPVGRAATRGRTSAVTVSTVAVPAGPSAAVPAAPGASRGTVARRAPSRRARALSAGAGWRLTDRGVAVVLMLFVLLMTASLVVVVDKAMTVTSPDSGYATTR